MSSRRSSSASLKEQNANSLLHSSIIKGNKSTLLEALKLGCNLKQNSKFGDPPLVAAAGVDPESTYDSTVGKDKMLDIIEILLSKVECDINARGVAGETALQKSMFVRSQSRAKMLLEKGADVDIRNNRGQTALFAAMGFVEGLEIILRYQPLLDVYDFEGYTPLMHAMMSESPLTVQTLKLIVEARCNVNAVCAKDGKSAIMVTLDNGLIPRSEQRVEKTLILIAHGIDVNAQDKEGLTALHYAVKDNCVNLVKVLLRNKASVDVKSNSGLSAVDYAKQICHNQEIIRLVERAADKSSRLLPYEEALQHLESLFSAVNQDEELPLENKHYLKSQIDKLEKTLQAVVNTGRGIECMSMEHKRILLVKHQQLCEEMMPHLILPELLKEKIISQTDDAVIKQEKTRNLMCVKLLELLPHRGARAFDVFLQTLKASKQDHVCQLLVQNENTQL